MTWTFSYNGVGTDKTGDDRLTNLEVEAVSQQTVFDDDDATHLTTEHTLRGTATIEATSGANLEIRVNKVRAALEQPDQALYLSAVGTDSSSAIVSIGAGEGEWPGYPRVTAKVEKIVGSLTAVVAFEVRWRERSDATGSVHILSHTWRQEWDMDEDGLFVYRVSGTLTIRLDASGSTQDAPNLGANPDRYRELVQPALQSGATFVPGVPEGFRQSSAKYAVDEPGRKLLYVVEYRQHDRAIPAPARSGSGQFTWRRTLEGGDGPIGIKVFDAELRGGRSATPAQLLASLIAASQKRIDYVKDWIQEIEISERDIFSRNHVALRVVAIGTSITDGGESDPWGAPFNLMQQIVAESEAQDAAPRPYGEALVRSAQKILFRSSDYDEDEVPRAGWERLPDGSETEDTIYALPEAEYDALKNRPEGGVHKTTVTEAQAGENPYVKAEIVETISEDTGVEVAYEQSITGTDRPYQPRPPVVLVETIIRVGRQNRMPERVMVSPPNGAIVRSRGWSPASGTVDANDNRTFVGEFRRVVQFARWGNRNNFRPETITIAGIGTFTISRWFPQSGKLSFPGDPRTEENPYGRDSFGIGVTVPDVFRMDLFPAGANDEVVIRP